MAPRSMNADRFADLSDAMRRALHLAARGLGSVEPNPPVGAVLVDNQWRFISEGWHERFGGPHAEINALRAAGDRAAGATLVVTLEPCCHQGKTAPCTKSLIEAGLRRVVVGMPDPASHNDGEGIRQLQSAGIEVEVGVLQDEVERLTAPFVKLTSTGMPYVLAKWAMTCDGKLATRTGDAKWISGDQSRQIVHRLRGRMDAIIVGAGTVLKDDPLLTARPPGPRTATRIVLDSAARTPTDSELIRTADQAPVLIVTGPRADQRTIARLTRAGVEALKLPAASSSPEGVGPEDQRPDLVAVLRELGRREMTNVLVEGGGQVLGAFFDRRLIDECHVFVAPKLIGGAGAPTPLAGCGLEKLADACRLEGPDIEVLGEDVYIRGRIRHR